jgi:hypothetical protein
MERKRREGNGSAKKGTGKDLESAKMMAKIKITTVRMVRIKFSAANCFAEKTGGMGVQNIQLVRITQNKIVSQ